nr:hypothetical protein BSM_32150 [uncultured archaeon]
MGRIKLTEKEVEYLSVFVKKGRKSARELTRAHVLLLVNRGRTEMEIKDTMGISRATVSNIKKRYREKGLQSALKEKPRSGQPPKYTKRHEAEIIAQACTKSSNGRKSLSIPMKQESPEKYDYEYVRNGTANIFVALEFKAGKRVTQVTERRTMKDFAQFVKILVDEEYPDVEIIRLVIDNLNTHKKKAFYETFSKEEAERILSKIEFHYTPKHASWLNAAEIEINVMDIECTGRRIGDLETLTQEVAAWTKRRNEHEKKIDWKFTREKADKKLSKYYV